MPGCLHQDDHADPHLNRLPCPTVQDQAGFRWDWSVSPSGLTFEIRGHARGHIARSRSWPRPGDPRPPTSEPGRERACRTHGPGSRQAVEMRYPHRLITEKGDACSMVPILARYPRCGPPYAEFREKESLPGIWSRFGQTAKMRWPLPLGLGLPVSEGRARRRHALIDREPTA